MRPQARAHLAVRQAIADGRLVRPTVCANPACMFHGDVPLVIEAHVEDASRPLEVVWLCRRCRQAERNRLALERGGPGEMLRRVAVARKGARVRRTMAAARARAEGDVTD